MTDAGEYCREIEAYLCRKNDGHLIRIVGPSFEKVAGWAEQGIPFKIACRGIDRYFERYYSKGDRRRPVRIDFCEADVLDTFDEWRRAVGAAAVADTQAVDAARPSDSLPTHLQRVISRLSSARVDTSDTDTGHAIDGAIDELSLMHSAARTLRGQARAKAIARLSEIERELAAVLRAQATASALAAMVAEAESELGAFGSRMPAAARAQALAALVDRQLREKAGLPRIRYE